MGKLSEPVGIAPGVYDDMSEAEYHGDPTSLSASGMKRLLKTPAHYLLPNEHTDALDMGSAVHTTTLGTGTEIVVVDAASWRGKGASELRERAHAEGKAPILARDMERVQEMAGAVLAHPTAGKLLSEGKAETSAFWLDEAWGITRRARFDWITPSGIILDLKTTAHLGDPGTIARTVINYRYDLAAAQYLDVAEGCGLEPQAFALVFVEKEPPYEVAVVELSEEFLTRGERLCQRALEIYRDCTASGQWPSYRNPEFTTIHPPAWARED